MTSFARAERSRLCDLALDTGPDAPTLCGDWTVRELMAHLVVREHSPLAAGIVVPQLASVTEKETDRVARRPFEKLVSRVRRPLSPMALPGVDGVLNTAEYFVHHEDVRRANGDGPRLDRPDLDDALRPVVGRMAAVQLWRNKIDVELVDDRGTSLARRGDAPPRVIGRPAELLLWLNGRAPVADVAFEGSEAELSRLWEARLEL